MPVVEAAARSYDGTLVLTCLILIFKGYCLSELTLGTRCFSIETTLFVLRRLGLPELFMLSKISFGMYLDLLPDDVALSNSTFVLLL